jgi:hypothetical protein
MENKKEIGGNRKFGFYEKHILASELFLQNKEIELVIF